MSNVLTVEEIKEAMRLIAEKPYELEYFIHHPKCIYRDQPIRHACELPA